MVKKKMWGIVKKSERAPGALYISFCPVEIAPLQPGGCSATTSEEQFDSLGKLPWLEACAGSNQWPRNPRREQRATFLLYSN